MIWKWLQNNGIEALECPGNSSGLNPIENAWNKMKNMVSEMPLESEGISQEDLVHYEQRILHSSGWLHGVQAEEGVGCQGLCDKVLM